MARRGRDDDWFFHIGAELQRLSDEVMRGVVATSNAARRFWRPNVDIVETPEELILTVELAGVSPDDLSLHFSPSSSALIIRGIRKQGLAEDKSNVRSRQLEIFYGEFERQIPLEGALLDKDKVRANVDNGFLHIVIPKKSREMTRRTIPVTDENG